MTTASIVRRATSADRPAMWEMFRLLHDENGMFTMSERKLSFILDRVLSPEKITPDDMGLRGFMGVIGPSDALEGFILLTIGQHWYTDDFHLEEYANFVHPDHRRSDHAKTLIGYARHISDSIGIPLLIGIISNVRTAAKVRLYQRQLPQVGAFFLYGGPGTKREQATTPH